MKSFVNLVKNEFIKIFAQTAYKIMLIIMIVLFMLVPVLLKGLNWLIDFTSGLYTIEEEIEYYQEAIESVDDEVSKEYYRIKIKTLELFAENDMDLDSWQYSSMYFEYESYYFAEQVFYLLKSGEITWEQAEESSFGAYLYDTMEDSDYGYLYDKFSAERKEYEELILSSDISKFYEKLYNNISEAKSQYEAYLGQLKANALYSDEYKYDVMIFETAIETCDYAQSIAKVLMDEGVEYGSWKYNSAIIAQTLVGNIAYVERPVSKNDFETNSIYIENYDSYESYVQNWEESLDEFLITVKVLDYSVSNNIPTQSAQESSSKNVYSLTLTSNVELLMYFAVVIAGLIVANEFSSGTARLLFIRPHSRNKILLSKYVTILLLIVALNVANVFISFAYTVLFNGIGDIFAPNLVISDGVVKEASQFLNALGTIVLSNFRVIFIVSLAFMMSTLCKKGALGIVVGIISDVLISSIYSIVMFATDYSVLKFTPFPYYMMEIFCSSRVEYIISQFSTFGLNLGVDAMYYSVASKLSIWGGIANYIFWISLCLLATFLPFRKQEIKN